MSLILEALRKSEAERRRDRTPDLRLELPPAPLSRAPTARPLPWLGAIALAVLALALWLALRERAPAASAPPTSAPAARPAAETPRLAAPLPQVVAHPASTAATATTAPAAPAAPSAAARPLPPSPAAVAPPPPAPAPTPASDAIPDIASTGLPPVKLSMHVWDADPARRFVILDGQRMGEGDRNGSLTVVAIDRKGVVVERDGQRARIPLP
ncbi:general secretion pathway protein GspB [Thermomonas sp.]|uniref:general secretion pathway protein GspB n=1 Tax=Thermomonas sp. TaxID=1971895 RepID=UPI003D152DB7